MTYPLIVLSVPRCHNCGEVLNDENWDGWVEPSETEFGVPISVPVCNSRNLSDDTLDQTGAY